MKLEELVGKSITEAQFDEAAGKKDACYHKVKSRYDVWPSAYASGALVKCRKVGAKNWGNKSKKESVNEAKNTNVEWNNFEKAFGDFFTTVIRLGKANTKLTGDKTDEKIFIKNFNKDVGKFYSLMQSWVRGQSESIEESYDIWNEDGSFGYTMSGLLPEAEYQGRKVKLGKPMQGDAKKFKVYVKNDKGNVVKVNFGQGGDAKGGTMRIRKSNPKARANFRARHNCDSPGPRHKARYWSCRKW